MKSETSQSPVKFSGFHDRYQTHCRPAATHPADKCHTAARSLSAPPPAVYFQLPVPKNPCSVTAVPDYPLMKCHLLRQVFLFSHFVPSVCSCFTAFPYSDINQRR